MPYTNTVTITFEFEWEEADPESNLSAGWMMMGVYDDRGRKVDLNIETCIDITEKLFTNEPINQ
jgi:hypothetical protein